MLVLNIVDSYFLQEIFKRYCVNYSLDAVEKIMEILEKSLKNEDDLHFLDIPSIREQYKEFDNINSVFNEYCFSYKLKTYTIPELFSDLNDNGFTYYFLKHGNVLVDVKGAYYYKK